MGKKIIITGGLGYIGTELCKIYSGYSWNDEIVILNATQDNENKEYKTLKDSEKR